MQEHHLKPLFGSAKRPNGELLNTPYQA